jgi:hypothetical protein
VSLGRVRIYELEGILHSIEKDRSDNPTLTRSHRNFGQYTWQLDQAVPGKHTLALLSNISSEEASVLIKASTGYAGLSTVNHEMVDEMVE